MISLVGQSLGRYHILEQLRDDGCKENLCIMFTSHLACNHLFLIRASEIIHE
jgi:hypothetical protein